MTEKINRINSPLTIIAIFAALAEVNATVAIGLIDSSLHHIFIWFVIGFPTLLVLLFFITLNYNTRVMYSPSDFREDKNFIDSLYGQKVDRITINETSSHNEQIIENIETRLINSINDKLEHITQDNLTKEDLRALLESQKTEIKSVTKEASKVNLYPESLRAEFVKWISFPAYLPIIYAIIKEDAKTISSLRKVENKYNLPSLWDKSGIKGLKNILEVNKDNISLKEEIKEPLKRWIKINDSTIQEIIDAFSVDNDQDDDEETAAERRDNARFKTQKLII